MPKRALRKLEGLWTRAWRDRTRGNYFSLPEGRIKWDIGMKFFPGEALAQVAQSLEGFKARLDEIWSNLVHLKMSLPLARDSNEL